MGLPLTAINRLVTPTGTPDMVLAGGGITNVATSMTLNASPGVPANVPAAGTVRALIYNTGDTNPEFIDIDLSSRSSLTFTIARETEEATARPKCAHSAGAGIWFVGTAAMFTVGSGAGGSIVLLEQHDAAGSASLDFAAAFTSLYDEYLIEFINVIPSTNAVDAWMRFSTDGGATYDSGAHYAYMGFRSVFNGDAPGGSVGLQAQLVLQDGAGADHLSNSATFGGLNGSFRLFNPLSTTSYKSLSGQTQYVNSGASLLETAILSLQYDVTTPVNACRFLMSSGNIASGTIRIYGVAKIPGAGTSGGPVLLEQHDAASSADLRFTAFVNDLLYSEYLVALDHVVPATNNVGLLVRCSTDGGATYDSGSNYSAVNAYGYTGGVGIDGNSSDSATAMQLLSSISNDAHWGLSGDVSLRGLSNTAVYSVLNGQTMMFHATLSKILEAAITGAYKVTTAVNALQFFFSSGNIVSGTIRIYGVPRR